MSAKKIKLLIESFIDHYDESDYAQYRAGKAIGEEKDEWEDEMDFHENCLYEVAEKIMKLKPSRYMINKYPELDDLIANYG